MEVTVHRYNLPDSGIMESPDVFAFTIWQPEKVYAILGRANNPNGSLIIDNIVNDKIPVMQRPSGGEAVILSPGMLVFSAKIKFEKGMNTKDIFKTINRNLIRHLSALGIDKLQSRGISDLSIGERKILGSSMYLNKDKLFYHAVMNISGDINLISRYLSHPKREPEYRKGRNHVDFVSSLQKEGYDTVIEDVATAVKLAFNDLFPQSLEKEDIPGYGHQLSFSL
ncbi:MAG: hypothetical protein M0R37_08435 [Bacteroidales bacterium]|nr:hypothetical protein [Bacteroidales bacterium]